MLRSALTEAAAIIAKRQKVFSRHRDEIERYRAGDRETGLGVADYAKMTKAVAETILGYGESSEAKYEVHALRIDVRASIDRDGTVNIDELFSQARRYFGIAPLYGAILSGNRTLGILYDFGDESEPPPLDLLMFDFLDIEVAILQLYVSYADQFGQDLLARELAGVV